MSLSLQTALERWGVLEAGARFGRVRTREQAGVPLLEANDSVGALFAGFAVDTLDDLRWPARGRPLRRERRVEPRRVGRHASLLAAPARGPSGTRPGDAGRRCSSTAWLGLSGEDLPGYDYFRVGGPTLVPGYRFEELKGAQTLAAAVSVRYALLGPIRLVARAGAGTSSPRPRTSGSRTRAGESAWGSTTRAGSDRWLDVGVRDGGKTLVSFGLGGY